MSFDSDSSPSSEDVTSDRATAHVGLVCTHARELKPLLQKLDRRRRYADGSMRFTGGFLGESLRVAVVEAGTGFAAHRRATEVLVSEHSPSWVVTAGFSSSLSEEVRPGDLCLATSICDTHGQQLEIKCPIPESKYVTRRSHVVADRHPRTVGDKRHLAEQSSAAAVDTNSLAVAQICELTGRPFLSIRAVIDGFDEDLPGVAVARLFEPEQQSRSAKAVRWIENWRQPPEEKEWAARATIAARRLSRFLDGVICQLGEHIDRG
jgi:adenosylhomocysteine nucleosidase